MTCLFIISYKCVPLRHLAFLHYVKYLDLAKESKVGEKEQVGDDIIDKAS